MPPSEAEADGTFADARPGFARALGQESTGWGATWADLDLDGSARARAGERRDPGDRPRRRRRATPAGARPGDNVSADLGGPRSRRGTGAASRRRTTTTTATSTSRSGRSAGGCSSCGTTGPTGHWLEVAGLEPGATVEAVLDDGRKLVRRLHAGSSYLSSEDPRVHFGLGDAARVRELVVRHPGGAVDPAAGRCGRSGGRDRR